MMEVNGVGYRGGCVNPAEAYFGEIDPAVVGNAQRVTSPRTSKYIGRLVRIQGHDCWAATLNPSFNCKILQLQIGRVADVHGITAAVEQKSLPDPARSESCVANQRAMIGADRVQSIALPAPPANQARRRWHTISGLRGNVPA